MGSTWHPRLSAIEPPNETEREAVPDALQRGTMDALSALAKLTRAVAETGRCDLQAAVYDGRRRADYAAWTLGFAPLPAGGAWSGRRCAAASKAGSSPASAATRTRRTHAGRSPPLSGWPASPRPAAAAGAGRDAVPLVRHHPGDAGRVGGRAAGALPTDVAQAPPQSRQGRR
ncbi:hypothetical protein ACFQU2_39970 [Siccirubricoccus deserti]